MLLQIKITYNYQHFLKSFKLMFFTDFIDSLIPPNKVSNAERVYSIVLRDFFF